jgi:type IV secretion system protein VirD4
MKKNVTTFIVLLIFTSIFICIGQVAGLAVYFKLTSIPMEYISLKGLYINWMSYNTQPAIKPYLQIGIVVSIAVALLPILMFTTMVIATRQKEEIHGSSRLANDIDLTKSGLFPKVIKSPVLLLGKMDKGKFKNNFIQLQGQTFLGVSAPTGSGKGVGAVIPNLVNYSDTVACLDFKLENFVKTAGFRQLQGQEIFMFAPDGYAATEEDRESGVLRSHRWNPYAYVRRAKEFRVGDILLLANTIYPKATGGKTDVWQPNARKLFLGLSLWMMDTENITGKTPTLPYLLSLTAIEGGLDSWMKQEVTQSYMSEECINEFNSFISIHDEGKSSIMISFYPPLEVVGDEIVSRALSGNDFDFRDFRRKGISLYVGVQPPNIGKFQILLNLFFEQMINENTRVIPELDDTLTHQLLLLLDEFPALGRVNIIKDSIGFTRQYNVRYMLIYQDKSQLEHIDLYGREGAENIVTNLATELIYPPKKVTQRVKEISETMGTKTVWVESRSISKGKNYSRSRNKTPQKRAIMMPHEIVELGYEKHPTVDIGTKSLIFKENQRSFVANKIIYFEDELLNERVVYSKNNVPIIPSLK